MHEFSVNSVLGRFCFLLLCSRCSLKAPLHKRNQSQLFPGPGLLLHGLGSLRFSVRARWGDHQCPPGSPLRCFIQYLCPLCCGLTCRLQGDIYVRMIHLPPDPPQPGCSFVAVSLFPSLLLLSRAKQQKIHNSAAENTEGQQTAGQQHPFISWRKRLISRRGDGQMCAVVEERAQPRPGPRLLFPLPPRLCGASACPSACGGAALLAFFHSCIFMVEAGHSTGRRVRARGI